VRFADREMGKSIAGAGDIRKHQAALFRQPKMLLRSHFMLFQVAGIFWRPPSRPFEGSHVRRRAWICDWDFDC